MLVGVIYYCIFKLFYNLFIYFIFEELLADKDLTEKIEEITIMAIRNKVKYVLTMFVLNYL